MKTRQMLGFFVLSLLSSATWLTADLLPSLVPPIEGEGFRLLLVGVVGLLLRLATRRPGIRPTFADCAFVGLASLGLIGVPFLLLASAEGKVASTNVVVMFAGMPILLAVAGASSSAESGLRVLPAGSMGLAGLLILLPLTAPHGGVGLLGAGTVLLAVVCTAACLTWLHRLLQDFPIALAVGLGGFLNGIVLLLVAGASTMPRWDLHGVGVESLRCLLLDLPQTVLLLWLVRSITPQELSVRYLVAPLLTVLEGLVLLRPRFEVRTVFGLALLGGAAYLLLRPDETDRPIGLKFGKGW